MKQILVTGGAGFIGSALCEKLLHMGDAVTCIDNLCTGTEENIAHLLKHPNFSFILHDIREAYGGRFFDQVYNLACPASPAVYQLDPVGTAQTCFWGACNMLELAKKDGARILQASTSEVYGDPAVHPQPEDYNGNVNTFSSRSCYAEGKRIAETLFSDYRRMHGVSTVILRIFNAYGPRMGKDDGRAISTFILQALKGEDITIFGDGHQTRSFCFVDDLLNGMVQSMNADDDFAGPANIGNPEEVSIEALTKVIIELTGSRSRIVYGALPPGDPKRRKPDISLIQSRLGWKPSVDLQAGLRATIEYYSRRASS